MRQPLFKKSFLAALQPSALCVQIHRCVRAFKLLPCTLVKALGQPHVQYRLFILLAAAIVGLPDLSMAQSLIHFASIVRTKILQAVRALKTLPRTLGRALRQPSNQYRIALLLVALLAALIGWTTFLLTLLHPATVAFTGRF